MAQNLKVLRRKSASDHGLATIKALLNAIPTVGGPLASLIGDYVPTSTQRAIEKMVDLLSEKLASLEGRIDIEQVNKEEFSELFKSCYLVVIRSHRDEKLRAAAALLANILLRPGDPQKSSYEELDHFVRCLDALSIGAITVLGAARHIATTFPAGTPGQFHFPQLAATFPRFEPSFLVSLATELQSLNLLQMQNGAIRLPDHGEALVQLTPIGRRFADRFIDWMT